MAVKPNTIRMDFEDNGILALVTGEHNQNLAQIEAALDVTLDSFGNSITVSGAAAMTKKAQRALEDMYRRLSSEKDSAAGKALVSDVLRWVEADEKGPANSDSFDTWKKKIIAKTPGQKEYCRLLRGREVVFGLGPAARLAEAGRFPSGRT